MQQEPWPKGCGFCFAVNHIPLWGRIDRIALALGATSLLKRFARLKGVES